MTNEELATKIQEGDTALTGQLWEQVRDFVAWKANHTVNHLDNRVEFGDLLHSGYIAMVEAVQSFDCKQGAFTSWLWFYLQTAFAGAAGYRTKAQREDPLHHGVSLWEPLAHGEGELWEILPDPESEVLLERVEQRIDQKLLRVSMRKALETLDAPLQEVIRLRFYQGKTLQNVAQDLGRPLSSVRDMERKALKQLRSGPMAAQLLCFLDYDFCPGTGLGAFRRKGMSAQEWLLLDQERRAQESRT